MTNYLSIIMLNRINYLKIKLNIIWKKFYYFQIISIYSNYYFKIIIKIIKYYLNKISNNKYFKLIDYNFNKNKSNWIYWTYLFHILYFLKIIKSTYQIAIFTFYIMSIVTIRDMIFKKTKFIYLLITLVKVFFPFVIFNLFKNKESNNLFFFALTSYVITNHKFLINYIFNIYNE